MTKETIERANKFLNLMDKIQDLAAHAEKIGWDEIHSYPNCTDKEAEIGWAMRDIANHINWWFSNSSEYAKEWDIIENTEPF